MNVLLITADSLRVDRTSLFNHHRDTTPFLDDFAEDAFEFKTAYANGTNTATSFPSVHTSRYQGMFDGIGIPAEGPTTLAECLSGEGYNTFGIHTNELVSGDYNYDRGFEDYHDSRSESRSNNSWRSVGRQLIGDGPLFEVAKQLHFFTTEKFGVKIFNTADSVSGFSDEVVDWIDGRSKNWFVWVHYMNPHHPYEPPAEIQEEFGLAPTSKRRATQLSRKMRLNPEEITPKEREEIQNLYDASIRSFDNEVATLFDQLESVSNLNNTLTIVGADHGEMLGENGMYGHPPRLRQELLRVPLLIDGPVPNGSSDQPVGLIDLSPTILELLGFDIPESFDGEPLFDDNCQPIDRSNSSVIAEAHDDEETTCCVHGDRKVIFNPGSGEYTCWKLNENHTNALAVEEDTWDELTETLNAHSKRIKRNRQRAALIDEDRLKSDLAALGYLNE